PRDVSAEEAEGEVEGPSDALIRPRSYAVGDEVEKGGTIGRPERTSRIDLEPAGVGRLEARDAFEERRLAGPVRADQAEHLATPYCKGHVLQRAERSEAARQRRDAQHRRGIQTHAGRGRLSGTRPIYYQTS